MVVQLESTLRAWIIIIMMSRQELLAVVLSLAVITHHKVSYVQAHALMVGATANGRYQALFFFPPPHN